MKHKLCTAAVCIGLLLALALPAWAAEYGEANITPQTTMNELRKIPASWAPACTPTRVSRTAP